MKTPQEIWTFQFQGAEVPHTAGAFARTFGGMDGSAAGTTPHDDELDALVERAKRGDQAALGELLVALRPRAMATAIRILRSTDDAEDAVQESLLKIWRSLARFQGRSSLLTWVHRVVRNTCLDMLRRDGNRQQSHAQVDRQPEAALAAASEHTPESDFAARELGLLVRNAITTLPVLHRQAIELRELEERSYEEMAEIIQCPIGTVMSRLHHARQRLASDLRQPYAGDLALAAA
jgi:RNA polymerase sigma-70 factor (ECF subfamily)